MRLYFNAGYLPQLSGEYIAWCDGMGTGQTLGSSLHRAANFIFKLHRAFSNALGQLPGGHRVRVYPLMDGMYVTTPDKRDFQKVLGHAFSCLALEFIDTNHFYHRFMVRGGIAYGATMHGSDVRDEAFIHGIGTPQEEANRAAFRGSHLRDSRSKLLLGAGMVPAYSSESLAPPFGLYVDDSALSIPQLVGAGDKGFHTRLWRWWQQDRDLTDTARRLWPALESHYDYAKKRNREIGYPEESIKKHLGWGVEYFWEFEPPPAPTP
jgi:hypothetical protein